MGSQDEHRRPTLHQAVDAKLTEQRTAADEAARPERERIEQQAKADADLYGTAGWDTLSDARRRRAGHYAAQGGGSDAS